MTLASVLEQLTNNGLLPVVSLVSAILVVSLVTYLVVSRFLFSGSKSNSSKEQSNKTKDGSKKKQETGAGKKKFSNIKTKKNTAAVTPATPLKTIGASTTSASSQSDESEEEPAPIPEPINKTTSVAKGSSGKKAVTESETNKSQTLASKQAQPSTRSEGLSIGDAKKKQTKANGGSPPPKPVSAVPNKTQAKGKDENANKTNVIVSNKKQTVGSVSDTKRTPNDNGQIDAAADQDDEGQWVTQNSKQVNNRNRNKGKAETNASNIQETPSASTNRKSTNEKRSTAVILPDTPASNLSKNETSSESTTTLPAVLAVNVAPEPIEICQLLPTKENPYTASDDWWKHALSKPQSFSVDDIGEWPEREADEQYVVNVKSFVPAKPIKTALTEKDVNIGLDSHEGSTQTQNGTFQRRTAKLDRDDEKNFDEQKNSASISTNESSGTATQSKKKATNVRRTS